MAYVLALAIVAGFGYFIYHSVKNNTHGGNGGSKPNDDIGTDKK